VGYSNFIFKNADKMSAVPYAGWKPALPSAHTNDKIIAGNSKMRIAGFSDIGLVRTKNEDAYWFDNDRAIFILADGLGAHKAGEVAANLAVRIVAQRLCRAVD
jgi:hypothetical protein